MEIDKVYNYSATDLLRLLPNEFIHCVVSDIPYGISIDNWDVLHNNKNSALMGASPAQKNKEVFKKRGKPINGWSKDDRLMPIEYYRWCLEWTPLMFNAMKSGASAFIFAGRRFSHRAICAFEDSGFILKDILAWIKPNAPHRAQKIQSVLSKRNSSFNDNFNGWRLGNLRPIFEPILWFIKPYKIGSTVVDNLLNNGVGGFNQEAFTKYTSTADNVLKIGISQKEGKVHPTQKPVLLIQTLIELATQSNQIILDPFCGSGTTAVAAYNTNRRFIVGDISKEFCEIAEKRLLNETDYRSQ